ncbi:hypothetical protein ACH4D5_23985 [Streptomyces sp. NPDC018029]|uniref:hypothetical protein n=1 Tax=Streptomyces sp. NPDC018029 TaxID=3365032 RepID=UPI0037940FE5
MLLGARKQAGARAQDYLSGLNTVLPVLAPAVPYINDKADAREQPTVGAAFERIAEMLFFG